MNLAYSPPHHLQCAKCKVYTKSETKCLNCGALRTGKEKKL